MAVVYAYRCNVNEFVYVGCTKYSLAKRAREHRCLLRQGRHAEALFQKDWNSYGESEFQMIELERVEDDIATKRAAEMKWMDHYANAGLLYNRNMASFRPTDEAIAKGLPKAHAVSRATPKSDLWKRRTREAQIGVPKNHGAKISATKRAKREARLKTDEIV